MELKQTEVMRLSQDYENKMRKKEVIINWATGRENLSLEDCEQKRRRPACASTQSDQRLYDLLFEKNHI